MKSNIHSKITCILLLAALLTSCGGTTADTTSENAQPDTAETEAAETSLTYNKETEDFGGYSFTFLNQNDVFWTGSNHILDYDGLTGDGLSDAVYTRNRNAEDLMNINIEVIKGEMGGTDDMRTLMNQSIAAMEDIYDVVYLSLNHGGNTSFTGESTINLHTVESLQFSEEWWNQNFIDIATIGDNILHTTIDYVNLMGYTYCNAMYFNRSLCRDYGMDYPYDLAREGKWTYDEMFAMMEQVVSLGSQADWTPDISGDAMYGLVGQHQETTVTMLQGCGTFIVQKDDNNIPKVRSDLNILVDAYDVLLNALSQDGFCLLTNSPGSAASQGLNYFETNRALFYTGALGQGASSRVRDADVEFGLLPIPKADVSQKEYCTPLSVYTFAMNIPVTAADPERTGKIMDYLAFSSYKDVLPVLQTNLCYKGVSDPTDIEMMNILLETETVDLGDIYNLTTSFTNDVCGVNKMLAGNNTFASGLASITEQVDTKIQELFEE